MTIDSETTTHPPSTHAVEAGSSGKGLRVIIGIAIAIGAYVWLTAKPIGFSDEAVSDIRRQIEAEFKKRPGVEQASAQMIRESPRKLTGFVNITIEKIPGPISKSCTATMAEDGSNSFWQCN